MKDLLFINLKVLSDINCDKYQVQTKNLKAMF